MTAEPKNIVICLDGTNNSMVGNATNVIRIFQLTRRASPRQVAYYAPGVGTQTSPGKLSLLWARLKRLAGMAFGYGTIADVENAYSFIADHYQPGDKLFLFGFSRGAYSARFLASVIYQIGILPPGQSQLLPHAIRAAMAGDRHTARKFAQMFSAARPKIDFLGVFDTVKSGFYYDDRARFGLHISLPFTWKSRWVTKMRHAMALDERRAFYPVNRWAKPKMSARDVEQVWFAGDHSDIGGGYPEASSRLHKVSLRWMIASAVESGLVIDRKLYEEMGLAAPPDYRLDRMHDRLTASPLWWICEWLPRKRTNDDEPEKYCLPRGRGRFVPAGEKVHVSVRERQAQGRDARSRPYAPGNLPADVVWVEESDI
ncbi:MAG: DUF2235 domain-containing protein [Pseudomonadota bacterium]